MRDDNCIFCKIANGEIPSATLYEDEEFRVILDLGPASKGHALILPKNHYRNLYDIDEATASKAICLAKKMITKMTDVLGCDGYNIVQNNEEAAGQTVFHFHMHLIPRYKNDNVLLLLCGRPAANLVMAVLSVPLNYFVVYPAYVVCYHLPLEAIIGMYQAIRPSTNGLLECLMVFNMPFTFVKGMIDVALCFLIYKPLSPLLHK